MLRSRSAELCAAALAFISCLCLSTVLSTDTSPRVVAERDDIVWSKEEEDNGPEDRDASEGVFVQHEEPASYSALYVYFLVEIIGAWLHVKAVLPSAQNLKKGPHAVQADCQRLLRATYQGAYNRDQRMSVMLSFNAHLWEDGVSQRRRGVRIHIGTARGGIWICTREGAVLDVAHTVRVCACCLPWHGGAHATSDSLPTT